MKQRRVLFSVLAIMLSAVTILFTWLFWPCSYSGILGIELDSVTHISAYAGIDILEDGQTVLQHYRMDSIPLSGEGSYEEVLGILNECRFRRNIRNLLPWIDDEYEYPLGVSNVGVPVLNEPSGLYSFTRSFLVPSANPMYLIRGAKNIEFLLYILPPKSVS